MSAPQNMYFRLRVGGPSSPPFTFIPNPAPTHVLSVTIDVDDSYEIIYDHTQGVHIHNPETFQTITTFSKTVYGDGPWLVAVSAADYGGIAGMFAVVTLDGVPISTTATANNMFRMTPFPPPNPWATSLAYDDSTWFTQTTDTCTNYAELWSNVISGMDAQVSGQQPRAMWYPNCHNTGAPGAPVRMFYRLRVNSPYSPPVAFVPNPIPTHTIGITIDVDDYYDLMIDYQPFYQPVSATSFQNVSVYTKTVYGNGPWMVSVHGYDGGAISGLFAVVTLDGVPYTTTATPTNRFRMTPNTPTAGWDTSLTYDDSAWFTQTTDTCYNYLPLWSGLIPAIDAMTSPQVARAMWYPDCYNVGANPVFKSMYFRLRVGAPSAPLAFVPNPVPSHVIGITMAVEDGYILTINGMSYTVPPPTTGSATVVTIDGVPYSTTATSTNRFRMTSTAPAPGWNTNIYFNDASWFTQTTDTCADSSNQWGSLLTSLDAMTSPQVARAMWYPYCRNTGTTAAPITEYFRLVVVGPNQSTLHPYSTRFHSTLWPSPWLLMTRTWSLSMALSTLCLTHQAAGRTSRPTPRQFTVMVHG
ncbi:hypothetical protein BASA81_012102 [Batrachochytrium salamandrivorans]|nr:hypothetical protein BASA81_012102 [Batrachochytrium salamandrivorans]